MMREVTKAEFKAAFFKYGTERDGWGQAYWDKFFEPEPQQPMRYKVEDPLTPAHNRMMIVDDFDAKEYRLFFFTENAEETHFGR